MFTLAYGVYFGVFAGLGHLKERSIIVSALDLTLIGMVHLLLLQLALSFNWSKETLTLEALDHKDRAEGA